MKRFVVFALVVACAVVSVRAAEKKIAILDIIDNAGTASDPVKACIHEAIRDRIAQFREFELYDISGIKEASHGITHSTRIEPYQAASLYKAYKVNHVVIVSLSYRSASNVVLYATLVELPSGKTINTATMTSATAILPLIEASQDLATKLLLPYKYTETAGGVNMQMVLVGEGSFQMGIDLFSTAEEPLQYNVTLDDYYIGATEVTQAQWRAVMGNNPSHFRGDNLPVDSVTWEEAQLFCQKLSELSGRLYTLPTEAQWEYAARGGAQTTYSGSNNIEEVAWFERNSGRRPHPVGLKMPNALGLYDMSGNIWEWCSDWFGPYTGGEHINPKGLQSGTERVLRGGSWIIEAEYCGITYRNANAPTSRDYNYGFRVVCLP